MLINTLAQAVHLKFTRIQFTPDLMPSDVIGTEVIEEDRGTGHRQIRFIPGPVFANVILADEINRTPPKTQAALLEAMQEYQVTVNGVRYELERPLFVRDAESDRAGRHVSAARGAARSLRSMSDPDPSTALGAGLLARIAASVSCGQIATLEQFLRRTVAALPATIARRPMRWPWWMIPFAACLSVEW